MQIVLKKAYFRGEKGILSKESNSLNTGEFELSLTKYLDDEYNIHLFVNGETVGRINYDNLIPQPLMDEVNNNEYEILKSIEKPDELIHLNYIEIKVGHRRKGFSKAFIEVFEEQVKEQGFKGVTLLCKTHLLNSFKSMGYTNINYLDTVEHYLMLKFFDEGQVKISKNPME